MSEFVLHIPSENLPELRAPFTFELLVPPEVMPIRIEDLYDSRIWVIVRNKTYSTLFGAFYPELISELLSGPGSGQYLLSFDLLRSTYFTHPGSLEGILWQRLTSSVQIQSGKTLAIATEQMSLYLKNWAQQAQEKSIGPPDKKRLKQRCDILGITPSTPFPLALEKFKRTFVASQLTTPSTGAYCDEPYLWWLSFCFDGLYKEHTIFELERKTNFSPQNGFSVSPNRRFDGHFKEVTEHNIAARRYIKKTNEDNGYWNSILQKTEQAEARHQSILREIVDFLRSKGITPLRSSSIDLAISVGNGHTILEIKSTTRDNFFEQCCKGMIQISYYDFLLKKQDKTVMHKCVLVEECGNPCLENEMRDFLFLNGVTLLIYRNSKQWPYRIQDPTNVLGLF